MPSIDDQKKQLRSSMKALRAEAASAHPHADKLLYMKLCEWSKIKSRHIVSSYWPFGDEIDPRIFMQEFHTQGGRIVLPAIQDPKQSLTFHLWTPGLELQRSRWKVLEPNSSQPCYTPDISLVPLLAFDEHGYRLGYGQGHYDRTLLELRQTKEIIAVGLAFDVQRIKNVPHDQYDQRLDYVVTPTTIYEF